MINTDDKNRKESVVSELYARKRHHESKIEYWNKQEKDVSKNLKQHIEQLSAIENKLEKIQGRKIFITTHALSRYRERVSPVANEDDFRKHIITQRLDNMCRTLGNGSYPSDDGTMTIVVEDFKIVTLYFTVHGEELKEHKKKIRKKYGK